MKVCTKCGVVKSLAEFCISKTIKDGHTSECKSCASARTKKYKSLHKDAVRIRNHKYWLANREKALAYNRTWVRLHPEKNASHSAAWRARHPEKNAARWHKILENWKGYKPPPHTANAQNAKRRAAKLRATPGWADQFCIQEAYRLAQLRTQMKTSGVDKWHVDHIVPLRSKIVCGLHVENNLQVIPARENHKKLNRYWPDMP